MEVHHRELTINLCGKLFVIFVCYKYLLSVSVSSVTSGGLPKKEPNVSTLHIIGTAALELILIFKTYFTCEIIPQSACLLTMVLSCDVESRNNSTII